MQHRKKANTKFNINTCNRYENKYNIETLENKEYNMSKQVLQQRVKATKEEMTKMDLTTLEKSLCGVNFVCLQQEKY